MRGGFFEGAKCQFVSSRACLLPCGTHEGVPVTCCKAVLVTDKVGRVMQKSAEGRLRSVRTSEVKRGVSCQIYRYVSFILPAGHQPVTALFMAVRRHFQVRGAFGHDARHGERRQPGQATGTGEGRWLWGTHCWWVGLDGPQEG